MSVKKIYSGYRDQELSKTQSLQAQIDDLSSYGKEYYIHQRDIYNNQQIDEWNRKIENFKNYSDKYYGAKKIQWIDKSSERELIIDYYFRYSMYEITGHESESQVHLAWNPPKEEIPLDPSKMKLPDEPTPIVDLQIFIESVQQKIREFEHQKDLSRSQLDQNISASEYNPLYLDDGSDRWLYQDTVYEVKGGHSDEEKKLLILEFADKDRRKFERLKNKFSGEKSEELKYERTRIPEEVRIAVWRRDQGRCARCGNRENLEYDHIVPVSKGGGNAERNIELLCQDCNRAKGNRIE